MVRHERGVRPLMTAATVALAVFLAVLTAGCPGQEDRIIRQIRTEPTIKVDTKTGPKSMKLEEYILGVVAGEIKPGWPLEAYKAQAILARSYALYVLTADGTRPPESGSITAAHQEAQAYAPQNITGIVRKAVDETRGTVITYQGKFPQAYFHSASGGWTTTAVNGGLVEPGKEPPYLKVVQSPEDEVAPPEIKSWTATFPASQVTAALARLGVTARTIQGLDIGKKDPHGRAITLTVRHDGRTSEVSAPKFRVALGPDKMRSALLTKITASGGSVTMAGRGFGHGVGMSQYGACQMAKHGSKADAIIKHYFSGVEVKKLWK